MEDCTRITERIIGGAIEVHRHLGPGLKERTYEGALVHEFSLVGLGYVRQASFPVSYKGILVGHYRLDLLVEDQVIVEVKSTSQLTPAFDAQMLTYLRVTGKRVGLLINFNHILLKEGIRRFIL